MKTSKKIMYLISVYKNAPNEGAFLYKWLLFLFMFLFQLSSAVYSHKHNEQGYKNGKNYQFCTHNFLLWLLAENVFSDCFYNGS